MESAFQSIMGTSDFDDLYLPLEIESVVLFKKPRGDLRCVVRVTSDIAKDPPPPTMSADIVVLEGTRAVLAMTGVTFARMTPVALKRRPPNYSQQQIDVDPDALRKLSARDRKASITTTLRMIVAQVLRFEGPDDVEVDTKFADMGLYSLASIEFRNVLQAAFHIAIAATAMIDYPKVSVLADFIDRELVGDSSEASAPPIGRQLADMSDADADAELAALRELT
jgi:acyl carrier protein